jgi:serine protease Do
VKRPYLGLELEESWEAVVGLPTSEALRVAYVDPDSPGAKGGIKQDDLFLGIGSSNVKTLVDYNEALKKYLPGETVNVTLSSGGSTVTKQVILGEAQSSGNTLTQDKGGTSLDADRGKTRIGDSHFGWTLKYPAGLVKQFQSDNGDSVSFADAKGEFGLMIKVDDNGSGDISAAKLLDKLSGDDSQGSETILERQYMKHNDQPYAKIIAKSDTSYIQARAFMHDHKIYYLTLYVRDEAHYKNDFKQKSYNDLLDSFQLSFDSNDEALKDISVYSDDNTTYTNEYGLSLDLPSDWNKSEYKGRSSFYNKDYTQGINVQVTSASSGDTLQDWVDRDIHQLETTYLEKYREVSTQRESTLAGVPAIEIDYSTTMGSKWSSGHVIYLIKDKYKYQIQISYEKEDAKPKELKKLIDTVVSSLVINKEQMDSELGFIQDIDELQDPNGTFAFQNEKYKYKLQIPENWSNSTFGKDKDQEVTTFDFTGGDLSIQADTEKSYDDTVKKEDTDQKKSSENDADYKYSASDETLFGTTGRKYVVSYSTDKEPYQETKYIFRTNNITYTVTLHINEAVRTAENEGRLNKAFESLSFTK